MINVKHLMEAVEPDDGQRLWIEPIGLTRDLREWCSVSEVLSQLGPPKALWDWFEEHPDGYEYFRGLYHEYLNRSPLKAALRQLAKASIRENITLLHQNGDAQHNTAVALHEYLSELTAYIPEE